MQGIELLRAASSQKASDVHLVPGMAPLFRINGRLVPISATSPLSSEDIQQFVLPLLTERQRLQLGTEFCVDFSFEMGETRYRGNVLLQRNGVEVIFRLISKSIPTPEQLLLPKVVTDLAGLKHGLVLITGSTGAGKSSTLACLINLINEQRQGNIITIEDPIEFVHKNKNCVVSQREIGLHAPNYASALRYVMRQDTDVVMLGEMRDLETIAAAISVAETGHLVFATLHSNDAVQALDRIVDVFPHGQQAQIRTQLASVLRAVVTQFLTPRSRGEGLVAVREILLVNAPIKNLIRGSKIHEIYSAMEMGFKEGMCTFPRALAELAADGIIDERMLETGAMGQFAPKKNSSRYAA